MDYETLDVTQDGGVVRIALNRPQALNAFIPQTGDDLRAALEACGADDGVRAIVLTGMGRAFSAGADIAGDSELTAGQALRRHYHAALLAIRDCPTPVIAAVNGPCAGVAVSYALACDLVVAAESAYFLLAFVNIGLVPDGGASMLVPRRAGAARAFEMAMLGDRVPAAQALEWGLCNRVVADDELDAEVGALAQRLAAGPATSYAGFKRQINASVYAGLREQLDLEATIQDECMAGPDFAEGVAAFREKRKPNFGA